MNRREALGLCAIGTVPLASGCLDIVSRDRATVVETELLYPTLAPYWNVSSRPVTDPDREQIQVEGLDPEARFQAVTAIHRDLYISTSPAIGKQDELFAYRGSTFNIGRVSTKRYTDGSDPPADSDFPDPVSTDVAVSGDSLTVSLVNELDDPIDVVHSGRPYFGVLVAVGDSSVVLNHDQYEPNESIDTEGIVSAGRSGGYEEEPLAPGESIEETYTISGDLPDRAELWFGPRVRAPMEPFEHPKLAATRVTLDAA